MLAPTGASTVVLRHVCRKIGVPAELGRQHADDLFTHHWRHPGLLLTQACGWPVAALINGDVAIVWAFTYRGVSDRHARCTCHLVVRADDTQRPLKGPAVCRSRY